MRAQPMTVISNAQPMSRADERALHILCSESALRDLPVAFAYLSLDLHYTFASNSFAAWLGTGHADIIGCSVSGLLGEAAYAPLRPQFEYCLKAGVPCTFKQIVNTAQGRRWTKFKLSPCRDDRGHIIGVYQVVRDIHEHQQKRQFLEGAAKQLYMLTDGIPSPITSLDTEQRYTYANRAYLDWLGRSFDEIEGRTLQDILCETDYAFIRPHVERAMRGEPAGYERIITFPDGHRRWMNIHYVAKRDGDNKVVGVWAIFTDIDRLKNVESELRNAHRILTSHVENTPLAVIEWDSELCMQRWSPQAERLFGWRQEQVLGKHPEDLGFLFEADRETVYTAMSKLLQRQVPRNTCVARHYTSNGAVIYCEWYSSALFDDSGRLVSILTLLQDLSERKLAEANLQHLATHDPLTGLFNRTAFNDHLEQALARARRSGGKLYVLFIDLDHFKHVNDTYGHQVGDELLLMAVARLRGCLRESDTIARLGGDEFTVMLEHVQDSRQAAVMIERMVDALSRPFNLAQRDIAISASIGISVYPDDGANGNDLLKHADSAMYRAKQSGRNAYQFFTETLNQRSRERLAINGYLCRSVVCEDFHIAYQPKISLMTGHITGVEALLRWRHPVLGDVTPDRFISVAEENGMIVPLGEWVLRTACHQSCRWQKAGLPPIGMAVNLSPRQFDQKNFIDVIDSAISEQGQLEVEISESGLSSSTDDMLALLRELKQKNVKIAIDNFGIGSLSLKHLARLPVDTMKIDRSFIAELDQNPNAPAVIKAMIRLAHGLNLKVVAEGVETQAQLDFLTEHGCDDVQGFLFSRPVGPEVIAEMLNAQQAVDCFPADVSDERMGWVLCDFTGHFRKSTAQDLTGHST